MTAMPLGAQSLLRQITDPDCGPPTLNEIFGLEASLRSDSKEGDDSVSAESWFANLSAPVFGDRICGGLALPGIEYTSIHNERGVMPERLIGAGGSLFGFLCTDLPLPTRYGTFISANMRSDFVDPKLSDMQYIISGFAFISWSSELHFAPGLGYTSDSAVTFIEKVPIPSLEVVYTPQDGFFGDIDLLLAVGVPFNVLAFKPIDWLSVNIVNFAGVLGSGTVTAQATRELAFSASFGATADVYDLSDEERFAETSRIFYRDIRATLGATYEVAGFINITGSLGHAFDRRWVIGQTMLANVEERIRLEPGYVLSLSVNIEFGLPKAAKKP